MRGAKVRYEGEVWTSLGIKSNWLGLFETWACGDYQIYSAPCGENVLPIFEDGRAETLEPQPVACGESR